VVAVDVTVVDTEAEEDVIAVDTEAVVTVAAVADMEAEDPEEEVTEAEEVAIKLLTHSNSSLQKDCKLYNKKECMPVRAYTKPPSNKMGHPQAILF
jgi:hypothetical protein